MTGQVGKASATRVRDVGPRRSQMEARPGRDRKRETWVDAVQQDLRKEFEGLCRLGVRYSLSTSRMLVMHALCNETGDAHSRKMIDLRGSSPQRLRIDSPRIQALKTRFRIASSTRAEKHSCSTPKKLN